MLNEMFVKLSILREPNMKMCTLVVYPGSLSFSRVMPVWTWKFDTIHCALCHHNSSHMLNEMFVILRILQDPNMKMCTLVPYPGPLSFSRVMPKTMHLYILKILMCSYVHSNIEIHHLNFSSRNMVLILD
jgi:hypothetical protein